jgi:glycosyltransferase involved in cell wall biosynthesis
MTEASPLKILHVMRAPVGGLFRHVLDLADGQAAQGHQVGIIAGAGDNMAANERLDALAERLALGVTRIPMKRQLGLGDLTAVRHVGRLAAKLRPDVLHGHGAKGGAYARLMGAANAVRAYTPHGGSLHYGRHTPQGMLYGAAERMLMPRSDLFLFESNFAHHAYRSAIGAPRSIVRVVHNGISASEFDPVEPHPDATDVVTVGELRQIKGIDVMIEAIALLAGHGRKVTATIVGAGPDEQQLRALVTRHGLEVCFAGPQPARRGFALGRLLVVPSRAESLPYVVLEAAAAEVPMLASAVGGIPEVIEPQAALLPPGDPRALAEAIAAALDHLPAAMADARRLRERVRAQFSQDTMVAGVLAGYRLAITTKFQRSP